MTEDKSQIAEEMIKTLRLIEEEAGKVLRVDDFLAIILHEFRNPMNMVMNYLHLLIVGEYGTLTDRQAKILQQVYMEMESLSDLVKVSFDMVHPETRRRSAKFREVNIPALLEELEAETQLLCKEANLGFACSLHPGIASLRTDRLRLKMALRNLLLNAVKYTERGKVVLEVYPQEEGMGFCVSDTGVGIPEGALPTIFAPFYQAERPAPHQPEGSGLGLHIVKRLLELLGGRIEVESRLGCGSTFRVWIPSGRNHEKDT
jgi:signal transduction histidine kinase